MSEDAGTTGSKETAIGVGEFINYRKHLDTLITTRATIFAASNSVLLFVFAGHAEAAPRLMPWAVILPLVFNLIWLLIDCRTWYTFQRLVERTKQVKGCTWDTLLEALDPPSVGQSIKEVFKGAWALRPRDAADGKLWHIFFVWEWQVSATFLLCVAVPLVFILGWIALAWGLCA